MLIPEHGGPAADPRQSQHADVAVDAVDVRVAAVITAQVHRMQERVSTIVCCPCTSRNNMISTFRYPPPIASNPHLLPPARPVQQRKRCIVLRRVALTVFCTKDEGTRPMTPLLLRAFHQCADVSSMSSNSSPF